MGCRTSVLTCRSLSSVCSAEALCMHHGLRGRLCTHMHVNSVRGLRCVCVQEVARLASTLAQGGSAFLTQTHASSSVHEPSEGTLGHRSSVHAPGPLQALLQQGAQVSTAQNSCPMQEYSKAPAHDYVTQVCSSCMFVCVFACRLRTPLSL